MKTETNFSSQRPSTRNVNMAAVRDKIISLKRELEKENDVAKLLSALRKLNCISVTIELLQETGIGKTIKTMRKKSGDIGREANALFSKWKQMVEKNRPSSENVTAENRVQKDRKSDSNVSRTLTVEREDSYTVIDANCSQSSKKKSSSSSSSIGNKSKPIEKSSSSSKQHKQPMLNGYKTTSQQQQGNVKSNSNSNLIKNDDQTQHSSSKQTKRDHKNQEKDKEKDKTHHHHNKKQQKSESSSSSSRNSKSKSKSKHEKQPKIKKLVDKGGDEDGGFNATMASFEDCLGLSDIKKVATKRKLTPSAAVPSPKAKSSPASRSSKTPVSNPIPPPFDSDLDDESLFSSSKLSPDVDISSTLPSIQPNYKPMRYSSILDSPPRKKKLGLVSEVDPSIFMSSKHNRTQVFSGRRNNYCAGVPSLYELCIRVLQENIDALEYTGGVPYDQLKPVLERCTPQQLYQIEDYNPYLLEDTDNLWLAHCQQDFKGRKPGEFETWREFYLRCFDEREAKLKTVTASISASMAKAVPVRQTQLAYVDVVAKPPRNIARTQMKYGTGLPVGATQKAGVPTKATPRRNTSGIDSEPGMSSTKVQVKKVAPLMQRTLKLMKNRFRR